MDVKDRGRCDNTAEAGLSAATSQELLTVAGVLTDIEEAIWNVSTVNVHFTVPMSVLALHHFVNNCLSLKAAAAVVYNKYLIM